MEIRHINQMRAIGAKVTEIQKENTFDYVNPNTNTREQLSEPPQREKSQRILMNKANQQSKGSQELRSSEEGKAIELEAPSNKLMMEAEDQKRPMRIKKPPF